MPSIRPDLIYRSVPVQLLQHVDVQGLVCHHPLQLAALLLDVPQSPGVVGLHAAALVPPAVPCRLGDLQVAGHLLDGLALTEELPLADLMEVSPLSVRLLACTDTVTGRGDTQVDASARGGDYRRPRPGTSGGHQWGLLMATTGDFLVAMDSCRGVRTPLISETPPFSTKDPEFHTGFGEAERVDQDR